MGHGACRWTASCLCPQELHGVKSAHSVRKPVCNVTGLGDSHVLCGRVKRMGPPHPAWLLMPLGRALDPSCNLRGSPGVASPVVITSRIILRNTNRTIHCFSLRCRPRLTQQPAGVCYSTRAAHGLQQQDAALLHQWRQRQFRSLAAAAASFQLPELQRKLPSDSATSITGPGC